MEGLRRPRLDLSSNGLLVSWLKASLKALIWACIEALVPGMQFSNTRMCLSKKLRACEFCTGSGDVIAAYRLSVLWM